MENHEEENIIDRMLAAITYVLQRIDDNTADNEEMLKLEKEASEMYNLSSPDIRAIIVILYHIVINICDDACNELTSCNYIVNRFINGIIHTLYYSNFGHSDTMVEKSLSEASEKYGIENEYIIDAMSNLCLAIADLYDGKFATCPYTA